MFRRHISNKARKRCDKNIQPGSTASHKDFEAPELISRYSYVTGERSILPRYVIEEDYKPPIFGSFAYDPVKDKFQPPSPAPGEEDDKSAASKIKGPDSFTVIGEENPHPTNNIKAYFRQHKTVNTTVKSL